MFLENFGLTPRGRDSSSQHRDVASWEERVWLGACLWSSLLDWASQPQGTIMGVTQEHSPRPLPPYYEEMHF